MSGSPFLEVTSELFLPRGEIRYRASRAGGPGGQHVNTSSTRVELIWSVAESPTLTAAQRERILEKLGNRINAAGALLLSEAGSRSQHQNRAVVTERLVQLLREALYVPPARKKTRAPRAARESRIQAKKRRSELKKTRRPVDLD